MGAVVPDRGEVFQLVLDRYFNSEISSASLAFAEKFTDAVCNPQGAQKAGKKKKAVPPPSSSATSGNSGGGGGGGGSKEDEQADFSSSSSSSSIGNAVVPQPVFKKEAGRLWAIPSRLQLRAFFRKFKTPAAATPAVVAAELVEVRKPYDKPPAKPPLSMTWIARLLRLHNLAACVRKAGLLGPAP